jgi:hypothetical protein
MERLVIAQEIGLLEPNILYNTHFSSASDRNRGSGTRESNSLLIFCLD